ncbi:hypothetical protein M9H77_21661 [Catharanthus roseus]|uniref:Uncharacterized protein n=1 Tax=Catharanthus roseus TaxID=4058 RepID=A0ACC0AMZ2_CATRO|nr:hypothetical protein M9H77_21661 [Catharanthus roseus]
MKLANLCCACCMYPHKLLSFSIQASWTVAKDIEGTCDKLLLPLWCSVITAVTTTNSLEHQLLVSWNGKGRSKPAATTRKKRNRKRGQPKKELKRAAIGKRKRKPTALKGPNKGNKKNGHKKKKISSHRNNKEEKWGLPQIKKNRRKRSSRKTEGGELHKRKEHI